MPTYTYASPYFSGLSIKTGLSNFYVFSADLPPAYRLMNTLQGITHKRLAMSITCAKCRKYLPQIIKL